MIAEQICIADLDSTDHFRVCRAIKGLSSIDPLSERAIDRIAQCTHSGIGAVERSALAALESLGPHAACATTAIVERLAVRLKDAGCSYACCGYGAFHGPVRQYIGALQAMTAFVEEREFRVRIDAARIPERDKDFIAFLFGDT